MEFASLTLFLIVSNCLAADNSGRREPDPNLNDSLGRLQTENNIDNELKYYIDFDVSKYATELESKYISIEKASLMSTDELTKLENDSAKCLQNFKSRNLYCEEYIHNANLAQARLLKQSRPPAVQHSAFASWKTWGFSAAKFINFISKCMQDYSGNDWRKHVKYLADDAIQWHHHSSLFFKEAKGDEYTCNYHMEQRIAIDFLYRTKVRLNSSDNAELERCISSESPYSIRKLARRIVASNGYSRDDLRYIQHCTYCYDDVSNYTDKITLMANLFGEELRLAWSESDLMDPQYQLQGPGVAFDVESALYSVDANGIVKAYEQCILKAAADVNIYRKCFNALHYLWEISLHKQKLEVLTKRFDVSTSSQHTSQHENVVVPAFLLINCNTFLRKYDNSEFMEKLNFHQFHSYEDALKGKRKLRQVDGELYNRLIMIEKCREYVQHKDDIAYIRDDFADLKKKYKGDDGSAYLLVNRILNELGKDDNGQQCFFNLHSKRFVFNTPETQETLIRIFRNKQASQMLIEFCLNVVSGIPHSDAMHLFKVQRGTSEYKLFMALRPPSIAE